MTALLKTQPIVRHLTLTFVFFTTVLSSYGQAPCNTSFTGFDPCSAEGLAVGVDCLSAQEVFRTNTCNGMSPAGSSCGITGANIVWGKFVVGVADNVTITWIATNNRNIRLGLYQFTDACDMDFDFDYGETEIACVNAGGNGVNETMTQFLAAGTYYIAGKSTGGLTAGSLICVHSPNATPPIVASDCADNVDVCTNLNFTIDPNGIGAVNEIPASGSLGNPYYDQGFTASMPAAWGPDNFGCLQIDESNSTWMVVNIATGGDLEFTFGGNGTQAGYYDWIMYQYNATSCTDIPANTVAPVRCNWNGVSTGGTGLSDPCCLPAGGDATNFQDPLAVTAGDQYIICFSNFSSVTSSVPLDFSGTASVSCSPLPVNLVEFNAEYINNVVQLNWATLTEINNDYFTVERSSDAINFEAIGDVEGAGNNNGLLNYKLLDSDATSKITYYRLKQTDFDGEYTYSPVVSVKIPQTNSLALYPNPTNGIVHINIFNLDARKMNIVVSDIVGNVFSKKMTIENKKHIILNEFKDLKSGYYTVKIFDENGNTIKISKVIKN